MPQISVDYSDGVLLDPAEFVRNLHSRVAKLIDSPVDDCKTVFRRAEEFFVGLGGPRAATVYLEIKILSGRSPEVKKRLAEEVLTLLERSARPGPGVRAHLAVNVVEMDRDFYRKTSL
ncbi:isomerase [Kitasatospora sp. GP82]|uniref:5-carboxymethyl-2-hydroxymuconate Delta-isomerase n=1 Tax=Kitasatospora sp. GP82 TaxID=3035089 RepID=UPI002476A024|nr:isomerase [Kitasatospora sp. GP82]MDH6126963.1 5-carboxymethyl-2-hydroxymuconate isomerase [Kitasatospora sp. GP82]